MTQIKFFFILILAYHQASSNDGLFCTNCDLFDHPVSMVKYCIFHHILFTYFRHFKKLRDSVCTRDRLISFFLKPIPIFTKKFSPIFAQLLIFDWPPIPIFQNLLTDIFYDILTNYFG